MSNKLRVPTSIYGDVEVLSDRPAYEWQERSIKTPHEKVAVVVRRQHLTQLPLSAVHFDRVIQDGDRTIRMRFPVEARKL